MHLVVEDLVLPGQFAGLGLQRIQVVVVGSVDDLVTIDGQVPIILGQPAHHLRHVLWNIPPVLPLEIAGDRVDRLHDLVGVGHIEGAAVGDRRALLGAGPKPSGPHHLQFGHRLLINLVERAVAPPVQRPAPHQPIAGRWVLQHLVGNRLERRLGTSIGQEQAGGDHRTDQDSKATWHGLAPEQQRG